LLAILLTCLPAIAQTPSKQDAEALLKRWSETKLIEDTAFEPFKPLGKKALDLFAPYLLDKELGQFAEFAMQKIDPIASTPYLLRVLPSKDFNTQASVLRAANRAMLEYGWHLRSGAPQPKPGEPPARFPSNTAPYPYVKEIHDVALAILKDPNSPHGHALQAVGLTGTKADIPSLLPFAQNEPGPTYESGDRFHALAALARLGDKKTLDYIATELSKPVLTKPAEGYSTDSGVRIAAPPGVMVVTREEAQRIRTTCWLAGFSMNQRFIPLLLKHLDDPGAQFYGDYSDPVPAQQAGEALGKIVDGTENWKPTQYWKDWAASQQAKPKTK
jgi:hypothetical protein